MWCGGARSLRSSFSDGSRCLTWPSPARVLRAASRDDSRPVLTGVLVEFADGVLTMAATDSYRMAVRTTPLEKGPPEQLTAIVPARALSDLVRIAGGVEGDDLQIVVEENQVLFGAADVWIGARRIEGQRDSGPKVPVPTPAPDPVVPVRPASPAVPTVSTGPEPVPAMTLPVPLEKAS